MANKKNNQNKDSYACRNLVRQWYRAFINDISEQKVLTQMFQKDIGHFNDYSK